MHKKSRCCEIESVFGHSIYHCVLFVGISTVALSLIVFLSAISSLGIISSQETEPFKNKPVLAINTIFALVAVSISCYQIVISILLLWQALRLKGNVFLCSLWYVSHMSILPLYFILFCVKAVICFFHQHHLSGVMTAIACVVYEGIFIYFSIIVNSYLHSIERERYF